MKHFLKGHIDWNGKRSKERHPKTGGWLCDREEKAMD
jgi:hypothetical protein